MKTIKYVVIVTLLILLHINSGHAQIISFTIPGASNTYITCVNDSNIIGGYYENASGIHGFMNNGSSTTLINFPGAVQTYVYGINNHRIVVGAYNTNGSLTSNEGFEFDPVSGNYTDITSSWIPSVDFTIARDIDDGGCVVGDYKQSVTHKCFSFCGNSFLSFYYNSNPTYINSINNSGKRAGYWIEGTLRHGLIYSNSMWFQYDYPGSNRTMFTSINDSNIAVGIFNLNRSFVYKHGLFREVTKPGATDFQIHDINNKGKVVGYYKDASNTYKGFWMMVWDLNFRPKPDGWQFPNGEENMWPSSYYDQFDYSKDPYLGGDANFPRFYAPGGPKELPERWSFPDWPLFVQLLGERQCYQNCEGFRILKSKAFSHWWTRVGLPWAGSCFGFVQTSFLAFDSLPRFKARFPTVGPWTTSNKLYDLPLNDENRKCINLLFQEQFQKAYNTFDRSVRNNSPLETVEKMKKMFLGKSKNVCALSVINQNGKGGHIVNPYKLEIDSLNDNIEYIFVYDNNCPNDTTRKITIHIADNCWFYDLATNANEPTKEWGGWNAHKGMYIDLPVERYYDTIPLDSVTRISALMNVNSPQLLEVYNSPACDILISNSSSQSVGFQGNIIVNTLPQALPITPRSASEQAPLGYSLPEGDYHIEMRNFNSLLSSLNVFDNANSFSYARGGAGLTQKDLLTLNVDGFKVSNADNIIKTITIGDIFEDANAEMSFEIQDLAQHPNSDVQIQRVNGNRLKLFNSGPSSRYGINIRYVSVNGESRYSHDSVSIAANTAHIIVPDWANLKTENLCIYIDNGNNGSNEDTICFSNNEPPQFITNPTVIRRGTSAFVDTVAITNSGGGDLNWTASSTLPSWLSITGSNAGTNFGKIALSAGDNTGSARSAFIILTSPGASNSPYRIPVSQHGILNTPTGMSASDGTMLNGVQLSWTAVSGATHYKVFRSDTAGMHGTNISGWISAMTFLDTTAYKGQFYYYCIQAAQDNSGLNATEYSTQDGGWRSCFTAAFTVNGECAGQPTVFSSISKVHTKASYLWDFNNDGTTDYWGKDIDHTFSVPGTYVVRMTVTDNSLCTDTKLETVVIKSFPALGLFSDSTVCAGQSLLLNAGSGFDSYLWSTGATTSSITVDSAGNGLGLHAFYVRLGMGNACSVLATTRISWDTCAIASSFSLAGVVTYDNNAATLLNNSTIMLKQNGNIIHQTTTDTQGNYSFNNLQSGEYQLTGTSAKSWGGVNSADALMVARHFVGLINLQGVRLLAADVNGPNSINSIDALLIVKRFVGIITSFSAGDWAFAKDIVQIGSQTNQTANLKAVVYGDVDGSYLPPAKMDFGIELLNKGILVTDKNSIEIPLTVSAALEIGAISLILNIPPQIAAVSNVSTISNGTCIFNVLSDELRIAWYSLSPMNLAAGEDLLSITALLKPNAESLSGSWTLSPESQLADATGETMSNVKIIIPDLVFNTKQCYLCQNVPNPFTNSSDISYYMPESGKVTLKVYNAIGQEIKVLINEPQPSGIHTTKIFSANLPAGIYSYKIEITGQTRSFFKTMQMVVGK
ncbi:MAG: PKD domain-containing protein [Bacteroidota bacterium]